MSAGLTKPGVQKRAQATRATRQVQKELRVIASAKHILTLEPSLTLTELGMDMGVSNGVITQALRRQMDMTYNEFKGHVSKPPAGFVEVAA